MTIETLQPYFSLINAIISLAVLGIVFNLIKTHRETTTERINALKDRLDGSKEDSERKDAWFAREKEQLEKENNEKEKRILGLKLKLDEALQNADVTFQNLAQGKSLKQSSVEVQSLIDELASKLSSQLESLIAEKKESLLVSESKLTIAKAQMASGNFVAAAENFDGYTLNNFREDDWEIYFSKAVNLANLRQGKETNLSSVQAYNDAINNLPNNINFNIKARLFGYRAAILKRLNRLDEALADLNIAIKYATDEYELDDINYNFSCVYALQANKEQMLAAMAKIKGKHFIRSIKFHLSDYFKEFKDDSGFLEYLNQRIGG